MVQRLKTGLALFGLSMAVIIAAELVARGLVFFDNAAIDESPGAASAFDGVGYDGVLAVDEGRDSRRNLVYKPYVVWTHREYSGELVNIDESGHRRTLHNSERDDALEVWMLGGSTMWGWGAPDEGTIPSHLARLLSDTWAIDVRVRNLAQTADVSTQEVIRLMRELQGGARPDVVIFYDGINEAVSAALWPEEAGSHQNLDLVRERLEKDDALSTVVRTSGLLRLANFVARRIGLEPRAEDADVQGLAEQAVDVWMANYELVAALGDDFGFAPIFLFQPRLGAGDKPLHPSEQAMLASHRTNTTRNRDLAIGMEMRRLLRERLDSWSAGDEGIHDLSDVFSDVPEALYFDWAHLTGKGNRIVAAKTMGVMEADLCDEVPAQLESSAKAQLSLACDRVVQWR